MYSLPYKATTWWTRTMEVTAVEIVACGFCSQQERWILKLSSSVYFSHIIRINPSLLFCLFLAQNTFRLQVFLLIGVLPNHTQTSLRTMCLRINDKGPLWVSNGRKSSRVTKQFIEVEEEMGGSGLKSYIITIWKERGLASFSPTSIKIHMVDVSYMFIYILINLFCIEKQ